MNQDFMGPKIKPGIEYLSEIIEELRKLNAGLIDTNTHLIEANDILKGIRTQVTVK